MTKWLRNIVVRQKHIRIEHFYTVMDADQSDSISPKEFQAGLRQLGIVLASDEDYSRIFKALDCGGDQSLSKRELQDELYGIPGMDHSKSNNTV